MHSLDAMHDMHDMYVDGHSHRTATVTGRPQPQDGATDSSRGGPLVVPAACDRA